MKINFKTLNINFFKFSKKHFGIASFFTKYVVIGGGYAGITLCKMLTSVNII
jgi:hypothetical protein